jgi:hypothetical protein
MSIDPKRKFGPNFRKLIIHKMSHDAIPDGGGLGAGIAFLLDPLATAKGWLNAQEWCEAAIKLIRDAEEPNPWKSAAEEEICAELLRRIDERKRDGARL